ncbi:MAG: hypothetical protein ACFFCS_17415 [Candidatus Hodarchaeota archaeon]
MIPTDNPDLFEPWVDPESNAKSYLLKNVVSPLQQSFYFTNPSMTNDERYLWFYCSFPPSGNSNYGRMLGAVDFKEGKARWFPETQFLDASPMVDLNTGEAFWASGLNIYKRGPRQDDEAVLVNSFPSLIANNRRLHRLATHFTYSADKKYVNIDVQVGSEWFVGDAPLDGSPIRIWHDFDRCYNHGQFSPTDPNLQLIAQDHWQDPLTGMRHPYVNRMWLIELVDVEEEEGECWPIYREEKFPHVKVNRHGHEWWDKDGKHVWYVDYDRGTERVNIETMQRDLVWPSGNWHSHCSTDGQFLAGDIHRGIPNDGGRVSFFDRKTNQEINIITEMHLNPTLNNYHIHPHPQFCCNDKYVVYTIWLGDKSTLAMCPVDELKEKTGSK